MDMTFLKTPFLAGIAMGIACAGCSVETKVAVPEVSAGLLRAKILEGRPAPLTRLNVVAHLNVKSFGAVPNDGKDDREAVLAAIEKAKSMEGPVQIDFEPGVYDVQPISPEWTVGRKEAVLPLQNCVNLVVDGHGAEILIHRQDISFVTARSSTNLIVRNFSIDYDPLPFSQGTVETVDAANLSFVMKLQPGFPAPDDPFFKTCGSWGMLKDPAHPGRLKADCPDHFFYKEILSLGEGLFRVVLRNQGVISNVESEDVFVINGRSVGVVQYFGSENITFDHLTIFACPGSLFVGAQTSRLNVLNCKGLLKGNRLIVSGADGVHCQSARIGPWVENCEFEGLSDDCLNIYGLPIYVLEQGSPTQLTVYARAPILVGDRLAFFNPNTGTILQETIVVSYAGRSCMEGNDTIFPRGTLVLSDPVGPLDIAPPGTSVDMHGWRIYDHAYDLDSIGNHFVYRNNYMHDGRRYGLFIKASNGLIEDNMFEGLSHAGMAIKNNAGWPEGFRAQNLVIQRNRISECGYGNTDPCVEVFSRKLSGFLETPIQKNLYFLNNTFEAVTGPAMTLSGVSNLMAKGNTFTSGSASGPLITIQYSEDVSWINNQGQDRVESN